MTRAFMGGSSISSSLEALRAQFPPELLADPEISEIFSIKKDEILRVAARLIRYFSHDMMALDRVLKYNLGAPTNNGSSIFRVPVIMGKKGSTDVVVFPNLPLPAFALANLSSLAKLNADYGGEDILKLLAEDKKTANEAKYATIHRAVRLFGRREVMPFTRALARYTTEDISKQLTPERIRTIGEHYAEALRGFTITWCEKPEDYVKMYERGLSSCMVSGPNGGNREWGFLIREFNINPTSFFYYHPNTKGAYVHRDGKVIARCIVYEGELNGSYVKGYGRIYSSNKDVETKFITALMAEGYTAPIRGVSFSCTFKVPKRFSKTVGGYVFPYPYFDNLAGDIYVEDTKDEDYFTVYHNYNKSKGKHLGMNSTAGYAVFGKKAVLCAHCREEISPGRILTAQDGMTFCSMQHANAHGYITARRGDGVDVLVQKTHRVVERYEGGFFTTAEAARQNGAYPILAELDRETPLFTTDVGFKQIQYHGESYLFIPIFGRISTSQEFVDGVVSWWRNNATVGWEQLSAVSMNKTIAPQELLSGVTPDYRYQQILRTSYSRSRAPHGSVDVTVINSMNLE